MQEVGNYPHSIFYSRGTETPVCSFKNSRGAFGSVETNDRPLRQVMFLEDIIFVCPCPKELALLSVIIKQTENKIEKAYKITKKKVKRKESRR